jgi:hypothetical protein
MAKVIEEYITVTEGYINVRTVEKVCSKYNYNQMKIVVGEFSTDYGQYSAKEFLYLEASSAKLQDASFASPAVYLNLKNVECIGDTIIKAETIYFPKDSNFNFENCNLIGEVKYIDFNNFNIDDFIDS